MQLRHKLVHSTLINIIPGRAAHKIYWRSHLLLTPIEQVPPERVAMN